MSLVTHRFDSRDALFAQLQRDCAAAVQESIDTRGRASLLLSGGSTPAPLYRALGTSRLDWSRIHVALVDERWVDAGHAASNERLIHETLLDALDPKPTFTGMKNNAQSPPAGLQAANLAYGELPLPHSLCLLGMGPDGHTASLFPHATGLDAAFESREHCAAIHARRSEVTGELVERLTLTPWSILQSERLILLITGADKWEVLQQAAESGDAESTPISHFIEHGDPLEVYWAP